MSNEHPVHDHGYDPRCREVWFKGQKTGECLLPIKDGDCLGRNCTLVHARWLGPIDPDDFVGFWCQDHWSDRRGSAKPNGFAEHLEDILVEIDEMMVGRHKKYGPGNIAEFGPLGILVRMSDKFARLKNGQENHDDETVESTLDDVIGYALIWKLWLRGQWPGSLASDDSV